MSRWKTDRRLTDRFDLLYIYNTNKQFHTDIEGKGFFSLKKVIAVVLVLALLTACCAALAEETGKTEKINFFLPATVAELELDELPVNDFPTIKTKKVRQITTITVNGKLDKLSANWMGYGETSEEVALTDGVGQISAEGHKYSVGTQWIPGGQTEWVDSYNYGGYGETFADGEAALTEMYNALFKTGAGAFINDDPMQGYVVVRYGMSYYEKDGKTYTVIPFYWEQVSAVYETYAEAENAAPTLVTPYETKEYSAVYDAEVVTYEDFVIDQIGGFANLYKRLYSNGWPNRAYTLETGEYAVDYTRAGAINYAKRTMENTDLFRTGIEGAKSTINWRVDEKKNRYVPLIMSVSVTYPEGSRIAGITASYRSNGKVYRYTVKYNADENKSYMLTYSAGNRLCAASYQEGETVIAKHSKGGKWVNPKNGMYIRTLEAVDGDLLTAAVRVTE